MANSHAFRYRSFDDFAVGKEVHLRLTEEDETDEPTFRNAKKASEASGKTGEMHADFYLDGNPYRTEISEKVYAAWSLHE
ncbi:MULTISPECIES: hypothetical protein [unclassified Microbacterium]|uniref:hypothetical protein n=1 Tax=unclassified Microbacterium TaxID=2609290 RepID=UPI00288305D9|nr:MULTISPECIES: hypothetical protein [unclassified Microbacterium]